MRLSRPVLAVPAAVVLLWGLTACGGSSTKAESTPEAKPSASAAETTEAPDELTAEAFVQRITAAQAAVGNYDFTMVMTGQGEGESMDAKGSAHLGGDAPALSMTMTMPEMTMEMRVVGGMTYMNLGELTGGKFLQIDPADASNPMAASVGEMMDQIGDPSQGLADQVAAIQSVTAKGEPEDLGGTQVQVYEVVIDPSKMGEQAAELKESLPAGAELPATITYTYWIGEDDLVRKVTFDVVGTSAEMAFSNYGTAAAVTAPAPEEIMTEDIFGG